MRAALLAFTSTLAGSLRDLAPIVGVVAFFQLAVLGQPLPDLLGLVGGLALVALGLTLFIYGLEMGLFPLGESMAHALARKGSVPWLLVFAFTLGFGTTVAEPALIAVADQAAAAAADAGLVEPHAAARAGYASELRVTVALSVGVAIVLGVVRILRGWPIHHIMAGGYVLVVVLTAFAPPEIVGIAYDSGGVTTSTITVPLVTALGVGLSSSIRGRSALLDGFGLIAFASLTPMLFVLAWGTLRVIAWLGNVFAVLASTLADVAPIALVFAVFQLAVIRRRPPHLRRLLFGFGYVLVGLTLFLLGLEQALFPLGRLMAAQLTEPAFVSGVATASAADLHWSEYGWVYAFAVAVGFSTTIAEPSLIAVALKAGEVSAGAIRPTGLRVAVAIGVAFGVGLGALRIVTGVPIQYFIIAGYVIVVTQTFFAPRIIVPLAYDSGGVTTSTVTVPLVAALGLGLAETVPGRSPIVDGFGLIAFASLFPIISVMAYAQLAERAARRRRA